MLSKKYLYIPYVVLSMVLVSLLILSFICYQKKKRLARNQDAALVLYNDTFHIVKKSRINCVRANIGEIVEFYKNPDELKEVIRKHPELNPYETKVSVIDKWMNLLRQKPGQAQTKDGKADAAVQTDTGNGRATDAKSRWLSFFSLVKTNGSPTKTGKTSVGRVHFRSARVDSTTSVTIDSLQKNNTNDKEVMTDRPSAVKEDNVNDTVEPKKPPTKRASNPLMRLLSKQSFEEKTNENKAARTEQPSETKEERVLDDCGPKKSLSKRGSNTFMRLFSRTSLNRKTSGSDKTTMKIDQVINSCVMEEQKVHEAKEDGDLEVLTC